MATRRPQDPIGPDFAPADEPSPGEGAKDPDLVPRPDNVGQSRRRRRSDGTESDAERGGYGNEESQHSTEQGWPDPGGASGKDPV